MASSSGDNSTANLLRQAAAEHEQLVADNVKLRREIAQLRAEAGHEGVSSQILQPSNVDSLVSVAALQQALLRSDWARVAVEIGVICKINDTKELSDTILKISGVLQDNKGIHAAHAARKTDIQQQLHKHAMECPPELILCGRKLFADATAAALASCGVLELARLACTSRGNMAVACSPGVWHGRVLNLELANRKQRYFSSTPKLLKVLSGCRWRSLTGIVMPSMQIAAHAWQSLAEALPNIVSLDLRYVHEGAFKGGAMAEICSRWPLLRNLTIGPSLSLPSLAEVCKLPLHALAVQLQDFEGLQHLLNLSELKSLNLRMRLYQTHNAVTTDQLAAALSMFLSKFQSSSVIELRIWGPSVNDMILEALTRHGGIRALENYIIRGGGGGGDDSRKVSLRGVLQFVRSPLLRSLRAQSWRMTADEERQIQAAAPHVDIKVNYV